MKLLAVLDQIGRPGNGKRQANPLERANAELQRERAVTAALRDENARLKQVEGLLDEASIEISGLRLDNEQLTKDLKHQAGRATRFQAEMRRLTASLKNTQQALKDAQPRIAVVPALDRPYVPGDVILPYRVPVGVDSSNEQTQELACIDQPLPLSARLHAGLAVTVSGGI